MKYKVRIAICILYIILGYSSNSQILDKQKMLDKFSFWHNKDWSWYKDNIPFIETPDQQIDLTWYYRWELITDHLVYGSPEDGYAVTEFIDRPWWSGTYGAISCAAGHQMYEMRWLRNPEYVEDYANYFFNVPGAQPRNYSTWIGDAVWQIYKTYYDRKFSLALLPKLEDNYKKWEKEHYISKEGMFAWDGMHDGMETNINSRQTKDWFSGAPGYRPTLNSYMWADAIAISKLNGLEGNQELNQLYSRKADTIKKNFQEKCWDPNRHFFFHRYQNDEDGGIKANTLTYQTGKYAGNPHGREEIGFIPWYFNMPDSGYLPEWQYLMDPNYFFAPFGPVTVEQHDPLFNVAKNCCAWSGNAWPYATSQTLKGMANVIRNYHQQYVDKDDYFKLLKIFSLTQRKDDQPYIAEANNPYTGSWSGHDTPNHSEHYFHSSYIDLIITGLLGLEPMASDSVTVDPLIPDSWNYFCLDNVSYHGHNLSVIWDRDGDKYKKGKGLLIYADGKVIASSPIVKRLVAPVNIKPLLKGEKLVNYAVNNGNNQYFPRAISSFSGIGNHSYSKINDGQYFYYIQPANRWTSQYSKNPVEWIGVDFGKLRPVEVVKLYLINDDSLVKKPLSCELQYWKNDKWERIPNQYWKPEEPEGGRANTVTFNRVLTSKIRVILKPERNEKVGVSELETWGGLAESIHPMNGKIQNLAYHSIASFSCSYTSKFDDIKGINDGSTNTSFRWTNYQSPNKTDWVQFDFGEKKIVNTAYLFLYDDKGGVQPPKSYTIQYWDGLNWKDAPNPAKIPQVPAVDLNLCSFDNVRTNKIRIVFVPENEKIFCGSYEIELYGKN